MNKYYWVRTREDYYDLMRNLEKDGCRWLSGIRPTKYDHFNEYGDETVIEVDQESKVIQFHGKYYYDKKGVTEFIEWKKGDGEKQEHNEETNKATKHKQICKELTNLYITKNKEYGDSFSKAIDDLGIYSAVVQMYHKLQRIINISTADEELEYESLEDNLKDLANYAIMTVVELDDK